jgi:hypothetical protein
VTFDREPDLDNANVGMPDKRKVFAEATKLGCFRSFACEAESCDREQICARTRICSLSYDEQHERGNARRLRVCVCFTRRYLADIKRREMAFLSLYSVLCANSLEQNRLRKGEDKNEEK